MNFKRIYVVDSSVYVNLLFTMLGIEVTKNF